MGTLASNPTAMAAFDGQIFKKGLDLVRSVVGRDLGTDVADPAATIRPGMLVSRNASGYIIPANLSDVYGVAKWGKDNFAVSVQVDLAIVLNGTTATNLTVNGVGRGNVSNVSVRSLPNMAGTAYVVTTDYTVNAGNGTVTRVALGSITDGQTVYVTFTYALVDADYNFDGRFFQNQDVDRTAYQEGRITVITDWSRLYTIEWASGPDLVYGLTGASADLYCDANGKFNRTSGGGAEFVGKVYQLPTATDPYLGVTIHGNPMP